MTPPELAAPGAAGGALPIAAGPRELRTRELKGVALVFGAVIAWALTGFFTRAITTDLWTTMAIRSFAGMIVLIVMLVAAERGRAVTALLSIDRFGVGLAVAQFICAAATIASLYYTTVADNAVLYATAPFWTAALALVVLGERVKVRTMVAGVVSLVGITIIVSASLGQGRLFGDLLGVVMVVAFAVSIVMMRMRPTVAILPPSILNAGLNCLFALPFASLGSVSGRDLALLACFGFTNYGLAFVMFMAGSRLIPAAQAALIATLDLAIAPLIVWATHGEDPGLSGIVGGSIVFVAVVGHIVAGQVAARRG
jgi:drug/metabolite transporter (DMT)-like permease